MPRKKPPSSETPTAVGKSDILPYWGRLLSRELAAAYLGISVSFFRLLVKDGRMPQARLLNSRKAWDRMELDLAIAELPHDGEDIDGEPRDDDVWNPQV